MWNLGLETEAIIKLQKSDFMGKITFNREQIYELVWSDSLAAISRMYNISYTSLRDTCKDMGIPIPPNGYWSKLKFGKEVYKERLFPSSSDFQEISLWLRSDEEGEEYFSKDASTFNRSMANITLKLTLQKGSKKQHSEVDPLVTRTRENFVQESKRNWNFKPNGPILDISVSKELQERALNLMNRFIQMMKACGHDIIVKSGTTYAVIEKEELALSLFEKSNRIKVKSGLWDTSELHHNGKLSLRYTDIFLRNEWVDTSVLLEYKLVDIIAKLEVIAENNRIERERREKYWEEQRVKVQRQKELQARKEKELSDFKLMFRHAGRYQKAIELRNYISTFEEHSRKSNTLTEEVEEWIIWARKKADWYDPFIELEDELLGDVNRETLSF